MMKEKKRWENYNLEGDQINPRECLYLLAAKAEYFVLLHLIRVSSKSTI